MPADAVRCAPLILILAAMARLAAADPAPAAALAVSTSMAIHARQEAALAFDGKPDTCFQFERPARDGDDVTVILPQPGEPASIEVRTGAADGKGVLEFGELQVSVDGTGFRAAAPFVHGVAKASGFAGKVAAFRISVTGPSAQPLAISEVAIAGLGALPPVRFVTRFETHVETAPDSAKFAAKAKSLCEEWYPRLYAMFDTPEGPAPHAVIKLWFQTMDGVAYATNRTDIHISNQWVTKQSPNDYGMVIHELFHLVQAYNGGTEGWLVEGMADYVRHHLFEPEVPKPRVDPDKASYRDAYKTTATFLEWLEDNGNAGIVLKLNDASRRKQPIPAFIKQQTGAELDELWKRFTDSLRKG
jgi:hypothetical protein